MMSNYDFQAAINAAQAVVNQQESNSSNSSYKYPLIYPQSGSTIVVRPLFNPASGQIVRLINRHEKVPCYRSYNIECPICKTMEQVKDMTGQDPFGRSKSSRSRGIAFAQFISSSVQIDKGSNRGILQPGEIILFMFPWSVYQQINTSIQAISQTPTGMDQAFCHADQGFYIQVQVSKDFKYVTTQVPYMSFNSGKSDEEFMKMLDEMESLNEQVIPSSITDEVDKQVKEYADAIYRQYIVPRVPSQGVPQGTAPTNFGQQIPAQVPVQTPYTPTPVQPPVPSTPQQGQVDTPSWESAPAAPASPLGSDGNPACFGRHQSGSPQCICCPAEMTCMQVNR